MGIEHIWFGNRQLADCLLLIFRMCFLCFNSFPSVHSVRLTLFFCIIFFLLKHIFNGSFHKYRISTMCNYFRQYLHKTMKIVWQRSIRLYEFFLCKPQFRVGTMYRLEKASSIIIPFKPNRWRVEKTFRAQKKKSKFNKILSACLTLPAPCSKATCIRFFLSLSLDQIENYVIRHTNSYHSSGRVAVARIECVRHIDTLNVIIKHVLSLCVCIFCRSPPMWMLMCNFIIILLLQWHGHGRFTVDSARFHTAEAQFYYNKSTVLCVHF